MVFQTTSTTGFWYYFSGAWVNIPNAATAGDNLGNHTATQALNLQANALTGTGASLGAAVGVGVRADGGLNLGQNTAGNNVLLGYQSGQELTTGERSFFAGYQAGRAVTTGSANTFSGYQSGYFTTTGSNNHYEGYGSGFYSTGNRNHFSGYLSGETDRTGTANTALGYQAGPTGAALTNAAAFGYKARVSQSNALVLGGTDSLAVRVGIGTTAPAATLDVQAAPRTGTHATGRPFYVTGDVGASSTGFEFRHSNGTQGIGLGYNTLYAAGSDVNQNLYFQPRGNGVTRATTAVLARALVATEYEGIAGPDAYANNQTHTLRCKPNWGITNGSFVSNNGHLDGNLLLNCANLTGLVNNAVSGWRNGPGQGADNQDHYAGCAADEIATGLRFYVSNYFDGGPDLYCQRVVAGVTRGAQFTSAWQVLATPPDNVSSSFGCPAGTFLTGLSVYANTYLDGNFKVFCAPLVR